MQEISFELIKPLEASQLSDLCQVIYPQFYTYLWYDDGQWYVQEKYNSQTLKSEIENPNSEFYFVKSDDQVAGYIKINKDLENKPEALELERIYFLQDFAGRGLGKQTVCFVFDLAQKLSKTSVILHVMDSSSDALAFYKKMGFGITGQTTLTYIGMKEHLRGMYAMEAKIGSE
jgi:diamine N-acetyltransferase